MDFYQVCLNYAPGAKTGPTPCVIRDMASFQQIPICKLINKTQASHLGHLGPLVIFFRPPDSRSEFFFSSKSSNKKFWPNLSVLKFV